SNQTRAGAAGRDGKTCVRCRMNDEARLLCGPRKSCTDRAYLVNRSVSRIELLCQLIEPHIATGLPDLPFLRGSHLWWRKIAQEGERGHSARSVRHAAGQSSLRRVENISSVHS